MGFNCLTMYYLCQIVLDLRVRMLTFIIYVVSLKESLNIRIM